MEPDRVRLTGVRSPEEDEVTLLGFLVRAGRTARAQDGRQTDDRGSVSGPVAAIDVVVAEDLPGEFRRQEVDLVGRLRAAEDSGRRVTLSGQVATKSFRGTVEGFVPTGGAEQAVVTDQRLGQARLDARGSASLLNHVHLLTAIAVTYGDWGHAQGAASGCPP